MTALVVIGLLVGGAVAVIVLSAVLIAGREDPMIDPHIDPDEAASDPLSLGINAAMGLPPMISWRRRRR